MLSVGEALREVIRRVQGVGDEQVVLPDARGRVLAREIRSERTIPPFRNSAMDGFAVHAADLAAGTPLRVVETIAAGAVPRETVRIGTAAAIMTGAVVPDGADTVVRIEDTQREGETVRITAAPAPGANIRLPGEDVHTGDVVLKAGRVITPADIGMLASLGTPVVRVARRPSVAVLATGDELVELGRPLAPGQIANSNAYTLAAAVQEAGCVARMHGIVGDSEKETRDAFSQALQADVVLSTGGVSMGNFDIVRQTLADLGVTEHFWKVAQKPGKPISFGTKWGVLVFGLPGNPVSSLVCFYVYVVPALRAMLGRADVHLPTIEATTGEPIHTAAKLTEFVRCTLEGPDGARVARVTGTQSSGALRSMSLCDGLLVAPPGSGQLEAGATVRVIDLRTHGDSREPVA